MEDLISRDEVLSAINFVNENNGFDSNTDYSLLLKTINELPSVKPQEPFMNKPCVSHKVCHEDKVKVLDDIRAEIVGTLYVDSLIFGELIDFRNGKISADDVIEEFNRVTRMEVLQIIDKYKAESEKEE